MPITLADEASHMQLQINQALTVERYTSPCFNEANRMKTYAEGITIF
jgi:hypothetical protein